MTKKFSISPRFSPTIFDPDASSTLLRAHLCTAVDSMRRKPCVRNCSRGRKDLYNGNVQQNPLCAASCVTKDIPIFPRFSPTLFYRRANPAPDSAQCLIHSSPNRCTLQIRSSLRSALKVVDQQKSVNVYLNIHVQRECSAEKPFMRSILCH